MKIQSGQSDTILTPEENLVDNISRKFILISILLFLTYQTLESTQPEKSG